MGVSVNRADLRTRARQRADMEHSTFVSDSELNSYINSAYAEFYDLLVTAYGNDYFASSDTITFVNGTDSYDLATDFYKLLLVELQSGSEYVTLKPFELVEKNLYDVPVIGRASVYTSIRYRLRGTQMIFSPVPSASRVVRYWYVPTYTAYTDDVTGKDFINGWEEYIIVDCAIRMKDKEESDTNDLQIEKQRLEKRIRDAAQDRDAGFQHRVVDTRRIGLGDGFTGNY